jgi:hypothetical protein
MVCRPIRARRPRPKLTGSNYFPCLATETTDDGGSSDESLLDIISENESQIGTRLQFDNKASFIDPPPAWDFMTNDKSWHSTWYSVEELKADRICYIAKDREAPFLTGAKALFRAKSLALECNTYDPKRPETCGQEFLWPVV